MQNKDKITGQVFIREHGLAPSNDGRRLVSMTALVAVPENFVLQGEQQYIIYGTVDEVERVTLNVLPVSGIDRREITLGMTLDDVVKEPIWRV